MKITRAEYYKRFDREFLRLSQGRGPEHLSADELTILLRKANKAALAASGGRSGTDILGNPIEAEDRDRDGSEERQRDPPVK